jgi:hypothetical protein
VLVWNLCLVTGYLYTLAMYRCIVADATAVSNLPGACLCIIRYYIRFEVFTAVTMKNAVFWDVAPFDSVRTDMPEDRVASIFRMEGLRTWNNVNSNLLLTFLAR